MTTWANLYYHAEKDGAVEVRIADKDMRTEQDGNVLGAMVVDLEKDSLAGLLERAFAHGVKISRRNPRLHLKYPRS